MWAVDPLRKTACSRSQFPIAPQPLPGPLNLSSIGSTIMRTRCWSRSFRSAAGLENTIGVNGFRDLCHGNLPRSRLLWACRGAIAFTWTRGFGWVQRCMRQPSWADAKRTVTASCAPIGAPRTSIRARTNMRRAFEDRRMPDVKPHEFRGNPQLAGGVRAQRGQCGHALAFADLPKRLQRALQGEAMSGGQVSEHIGILLRSSDREVEFFFRLGQSLKPTFVHAHGELWQGRALERGASGRTAARAVSLSTSFRCGSRSAEFDLRMRRCTAAKLRTGGGCRQPEHSAGQSRI